MDDELQARAEALIVARLALAGRAAQPAELGAAAAESALVGTLTQPFRERLSPGDAPGDFCARLPDARDG